MAHPSENSRKLVRKASNPVTHEMAKEIRRLKRDERLYNHQIAALLNINQGRVSEVLSGKLHPEEKPQQRSLFDF
jgi:predicted XRE-type DNA-binding protein